MGSATVFSFDDLVKLHDEFLSKARFHRLGRLIKLVLGEVPSGVPLNLHPIEIAREGRTLDWFDVGPAIGMSPGDVDLLTLSPVPPLPDKPDPAWKPEEVSEKAIKEAIDATGKWAPPRAPLVKQLPEDRGARRIRGSNILLFEPVHQALFRPEGTNVFGCVTGYSFGDTVPTFAWNFDTGRGYFYGGRWIVKI